jgi:hypothetical protein
VDCFFVLETVPDVQCSPETYEDCMDIVKEVIHALGPTNQPTWQVPYFQPKEECQEVPYEQCVNIEEKVGRELNTGPNIRILATGQKYFP